LDAEGAVEWRVSGSGLGMEIRLWLCLFASDAQGETDQTPKLTIKFIVERAG
jgi:hypothetical protein